MLATITSIIAAHWGIAIAGGTGIAAIASFFMPKIMDLKVVQHGLGWFLQTAQWAALPFAKWLKMGPFKHLIVVPLLILQIVGAWVMRFNDLVLNQLDDSAKAMAKGISDALAKVGSTDQKLYYDAKGMTQEQVDAVVGVATAVTSQASLDPEEKAALDKTMEAGKALMEEKLKQG